MYACTIMLQRSHFQEVITTDLKWEQQKGIHIKVNIYLTIGSKKEKEKEKSFGATDYYIVHC